MKIKNIILGIALVSLTSTSFGQRSSIKERVFNKQNNQVEYITADYSMNESSRIESWMHDVRSWANQRFTRNSNETPSVSQTIFVEKVEVVYEEEVNLESWMTTPFECSLADEELTIELWMTTPFEAAEDIEVEDWMFSTWI